MALVALGALVPLGGLGVLGVLWELATNIDEFKSIDKLP
jgi:hypothetical protein